MKIDNGSSSHSNVLGEMIRDLRRAKTQIHNGRAWCQEDLAVAIGSDKAHINRLEKGKQQPNPETLKKICDALDANWSQRRNLAALAGHLNSVPLVTEEAVSTVLEQMQPELFKLKHPYVLQDMEHTIWDINSLMTFTFYGYESREKFLDECQGLRFIEILMTPMFFDWFQKVIENFEAFFRYEVVRFMDIYLKYHDQEDYQSLLTRFQGYSDFHKIWSELYLQQDNAGGEGFLDHHTLHINHPSLGRFSVQVWQCEIVKDYRFRLVAHIGDDAYSNQMIRELYDTLNKK